MKKKIFLPPKIIIAFPAGILNLLGKVRRISEWTQWMSWVVCSELPMNTRRSEPKWLRMIRHQTKSMLTVVKHPTVRGWEEER